MGSGRETPGAQHGLERRLNQRIGGRTYAFGDKQQFIEHGGGYNHFTTVEAAEFGLRIPHRNRFVVVCQPTGDVGLAKI